MSEYGEHQRVPFYACDACSIVYARPNQPKECRVCGSESFVEVMPKDQSY